MISIMQTLGILGGGQLGRMLIAAATSFPIQIHVLDPQSDCPCADFCHFLEIGNLMDFETVYAFGKNLDYLTIEFEHINTKALQKLEEEGVQVYPQSSIIKLVQDKSKQKQFYKQHQIPTAPFIVISGKNELLSIKQNKNYPKFCQEFPIVQKSCHGGYDGKGVVVLKNREEIENKAFDVTSIIEEKIEIEKELSVIVARNKQGETRSFPPVEMEFDLDANLVKFIHCPSTLPFYILQKAEKIAQDLICKLDMIGLLAVEMFYTKTGEILVNEIAPRPHNSGHGTIEGVFTSQFTQHLRAIFGFPLGSTDLVSAYSTINLLGDKNSKAGKTAYYGLKECLKLEKTYVHLYGKKECKPIRKMGHATILGDDLLEKAEWIMKNLLIKGV